jgi:hypothetical protein
MNPEAYSLAVSSLTAKHIHAIGYRGDSDPAYALEQVRVANTGTTAVRVGTSLTGVLGSAYVTVANSTVMQIEGPREGLVVYNPEASTAGTVSMTADCWRRNAGLAGGLKPRKDSPGSATRYFVARPTKTAGETKDTELVMQGRYTVTSIKLYSVTVASGGTITLDVLDSKGRSLLSAAYDLETLTTATLATATLTSSTDLLTLAPNATLTLRYSSSAGGDTLGDLAVEIGVTEA